MTNFLSERPHRRYNPLTDEWMLVSPQRAKRPWQGQVEDTPSEVRPQYDPNCYLCPTNMRVGGKQNPDYEGTFVFDNDFPALLPDSSIDPPLTDPLYRAEVERGVCRVVCFSPRHDLTLALMGADGIRTVVDLWAEQTNEISEQYPWVKYVQVFENRGKMMGSSNPHPHGQIWATEHLSLEVMKEDRAQKVYFQTTNRTMLSVIVETELEQKERVVYTNADWIVCVPFWAVWPFEVLVVPKRPVQWIGQLTAEERDNFADALSVLTVKYDNLFQTSFPYSMGVHQAPVNVEGVEHWHLHAHFYPPLLRSATVKKFMVGYEMLGTPQRDITAEQAAVRLRELPEVHYTAVLSSE